METGDDLLCSVAICACRRRISSRTRVERQSESATIRRAHAMSSDRANAGAVAFSRRGNPNLGEFDDAVILKTFGQYRRIS